jgi:ubiquinone/menaquinone biosynthesis C-methylase UbiE
MVQKSREYTKIYLSNTMNKWDKFFDEKIKEISKEKTILDIGGGSGWQKKLKAYRDCFNDCDYKVIDMDPNCHPDVLADIHDIPFPNNYADGVICKSVLEHVENPFKVVSEIFRVTKDGGKCFISVPFIHAYHGHDYWRFSEDGIRYLFKNFKKIEIMPISGHFETMANLLPYNKSFPVKLLITTARFLDKISARFQSGKQVSGYNVFLVK